MQPQPPTNKSQEEQKRQKKKVKKELTVEEAIQLTMEQFKHAIEYLKDR